MGRFINRLPKICGVLNEAGNETVTAVDPDNRKNFSTKSVFSDKTRGKYNNFAHGDAYIPDKWGVAWGKHSIELAKEVIKFVKDNPGNAAIEPFLKQHHDQIFAQPDKKVITGESEDVVTEDGEGNGGKIDYKYYIKLCDDCIDNLHRKRDQFMDKLNNLGWRDKKFESRQKVDALTHILKDSFVPVQDDANDVKKDDEKKDGENQDGEKSSENPASGDAGEAKPEDGNAGGSQEQGNADGVKPDGQQKDETPEVDGDKMDDQKSIQQQVQPQQQTQQAQQQSAQEPQQQSKFIQGYKARHVNKAKPRTYQNCWQMIGAFRNEYDKKGEVTNRIIHKMFEVVNKLKNDPKHIEQKHGEPVGEDEAQVVAKQALQLAGAPNAARAVA
jgi:hypothetical protein